MGCYKSDKNTSIMGCHYNCKDPNDCNNLSRKNIAPLPSLKYYENEDNDICLCRGDYCNQTWYSGWQIAGIIGFIVVCVCFICYIK